MSAVPSKITPPRNNGSELGTVALIEIDEVVEFCENVAMSVFADAVLPGKVPSPVLQLFSPATASHTPFVGVADQVAGRACAELVVSETPATVRAMLAARNFTELGLRVIENDFMKVDT